VTTVHELSIAVAVAEQVQDALGGQDVQVESLTVRIGELAGVVPEALEFSFQLACAGTALAGARLLIETVEGRAHCDRCGRDGPTGMPPVLWCTDCGTPLTLLTGRELEIARVVLDDGSGDGAHAPGASRAGAPQANGSKETNHVPHR